MLKAVIFDMDGVIIDSEPTHARANVLALSRYGIDITMEYCLGFVGTPLRKIIETIREKYHISIPIDELCEAAEAAKAELTKEEGLVEIPGVKNLILDLHNHGIPMAIASSSPMCEIDKVLDAFGIRHYFNQIISGATIEHPKPAPDVFLLAAKALNFEPSECVVIEDSNVGCIASKAAGIPCIGFSNPHSGNQDLSLATIIIKDFHTIDCSFIRRVSDL